MAAVERTNAAEEERMLVELDSHAAYVLLLAGSSKGRPAGPLLSLHLACEEALVGVPLIEQLAPFS